MGAIQRGSGAVKSAVRYGAVAFRALKRAKNLKETAQQLSCFARFREVLGASYPFATNCSAEGRAKATAPGVTEPQAS